MKKEEFLDELAQKMSEHFSYEDYDKVSISELQEAIQNEDKR